MSRSGWTEFEGDDPSEIGRHNLFRANVLRSIRGKKGQSFLRELATALDEMPVKELIADELISDDGEICAIGAVCKARKLDVSETDYECPEQVAALVGIPEILASEIEYENDEAGWNRRREEPSERWSRMRNWVADRIRDPN